MIVLRPHGLEGSMLGHVCSSPRQGRWIKFSESIPDLLSDDWNSAEAAMVAISNVHEFLLG
jgi:hypothetical protein